MAEKKTTQLKKLFLDRYTTTLMPMGAFAVHAQMAEKLGFPAFEMSGGMAVNWVEGFADHGLVTMPEMVANAHRMVRSTGIPIFADADTAFGSAINVVRTTKEYLGAGVAGIHIEDQMEPKKSGGTAGMRLVPDGEAVGRLAAAVDTKNGIDPDFVIVARTDAYAAEGGSLDEAIRRGNLYLKEAGVDVIFFEGIRSWDEIRRALKETDGPAYAIPSRHAGPHPSVAEMSEMGQTIVVVPFALATIPPVWKLLREVRTTGEVTPYDDWLANYFAETQGTEDFVGYGMDFSWPPQELVRTWEARYLPAHLQRDYENTVHDGA